MCVRAHERECSQTDGRTDHKDAKFKKNPIDPAIRFVMINFISVTTSMVDNIVPTSPFMGGGSECCWWESPEEGVGWKAPLKTVRVGLTKREGERNEERYRQQVVVKHHAELGDLDVLCRRLHVENIARRRQAIHAHPKITATACAWCVCVVQCIVGAARSKHT